MAGSDEAPPDPGDITQLLVSSAKVTATRSIVCFRSSTPNCGHGRIVSSLISVPVTRSRRRHSCTRPTSSFSAPRVRSGTTEGTSSRSPAAPCVEISVDYALTQAAQKRGGGTPALTLDEQRLPVADRAHELVLLDGALTELESFSARPARVVELRFFGGLSIEETAAVMDVSERTVKREWQKARAFLFDALRREGLG